MDRSHSVMWWTPVGELPSIADAIQRLDHLRDHGPSPTAFTFGHLFGPDGRPMERTPRLDRECGVLSGRSRAAQSADIGSPTDQATPPPRSIRSMAAMSDASISNENRSRFCLTRSSWVLFGSTANPFWTAHRRST